MRRALAIAAGLTLVAVPGARASTARVGTTGAVDYAAAPGEVNALRASVSGSTVTLADDGATIAAGSRCTAVTAHRVTCVVSQAPALSAALGDGGDTAAVTGLLPAVLDGGPGDDTLTGGDGPDVLEGGTGDDVLRGAGADDTLFGDGPGLATGGGADRLDGGAGADAVDCGGGSADVVLDSQPEDRTAGCETAATNPAPPPPAPEPAPAATPTSPPPAAAPPANPLDPGVIAPVQPAAPAAPVARAATVVPVTLTLRAPAAIGRSTLRRTGLRAIVACSIRCAATLRLNRGPRTLARRSVTATTRPVTVRLRARTAAGALTLRVSAPDVTTQARRVRVAAR